MRRFRLPALSLAFALAAGALARAPADDAKPVPASFRCYVVADKRTYDGEPKITRDPVNNIARHEYKAAADRDPKNRTERIHDLVADNALNPVVAVFYRTVPKADEPASKLALDLRKLLKEERAKAKNMGAFVVFVTLEKEFQLDEKRDEADAAAFNWAVEAGKDLAPYVISKEKVAGGGEVIKRSAGGLENMVVGLTGKEAEAAKAWELGENDDVTVVLYHRLKIVKRWGFAAGKFTDDDAKAVIDATEAELKAK